MEIRFNTKRKNKFSTKTSLNNHQRTAKYCLKLRNIKVDSGKKCDGCGKTFTRSYHLQRHEQKCRSNEKMFKLETELVKVIVERDTYENKVKEQQQIIQDMKNTISNPSRQVGKHSHKSCPTTHNN